MIRYLGYMRDHFEWYTLIKKSLSEELLDRSKAVSILTRNLQVLVTEMLKVKIGESPSIMHEISKYTILMIITYGKIEDLNLVILKQLL